MTTISYTAYAYINPSYDSIDRVRSGRSMPLILSANPTNSHMSEYTYVGQVSVTIDLVNNDEFVANQVKSLNVQLAQVRAEAQQKENQILLQISKLQALTMG